MTSIELPIALRPGAVGRMRPATSPAHALTLALGALTLVLASCTTVPPVVESYPAADAHRVVVNGVLIHYFDFRPDAPGTPIVWLHGYSGSAFEVNSIKDDLGGRRLIAPDLPGCGYSEKPETEYTLDYFLAFVHDFVETIGIDRYDLVGHSMGGYIASAYASAHPPRSLGGDGPENLVLVSPYGLEGEAGAFLSFLADSGALVDYGLKLNSKTFLQLAMPLGLFHDADRIPQDLVDYLAVSNFHTPNAVPALASITRNVIGGEPDESALTQIVAPALIVWGTDDRILSFRFSDEFAELIPWCTVVPIEACGHLPHVERPQETGAAIRTFLDAPDGA